MSGKAPTPELEPIFTQMRKWMYEVYETIKALGRPMPKETRVLLDRYFGKVPLEFEAPKNVYRRTSLPDSSDVAGIERLVDETTEMLARGNLDSKPVDRKTIAGNMHWLEQQVLPYIGELDGRVATQGQGPVRGVRRGEGRQVDLHPRAGGGRSATTAS